MKEELLEVRPMHTPSLRGIEIGFLSTTQRALDKSVRDTETLSEIAVGPRPLADGSEAGEDIDVGWLEHRPECIRYRYSIQVSAN